MINKNNLNEFKTNFLKLKKNKDKNYKKQLNIIKKNLENEIKFLDIKKTLHNEIIIGEKENENKIHEIYYLKELVYRNIIIGNKEYLVNQKNFEIYENYHLKLEEYLVFLDFLKVKFISMYDYLKNNKLKNLYKLEKQKQKELYNSNKLSKKLEAKWFKLVNGSKKSFFQNLFN